MRATERLAHAEPRLGSGRRVWGGALLPYVTSLPALWYSVKPLHVTAAAGPGPAAGPEYQYSRLCVSMH